MDDVRTSFNLIDEPWIGVKLLSGDIAEYSMIEVFRQAAAIERLANELPTQDFAILRILLAVVQRSVLAIEDEYEYPSDAWGALWEAKELPLGEIESYLDGWHDRFDLFDEEWPFMQVAGLNAANGTISEIKKIIADVPDGKPLFSLLSLRGLDSLGFNEVARWLIHVHAFDTSGIKTGVIGDSSVKGGKSYPIGTGWAGNLGGVYLEGTNLVETLLLNTIFCEDCYDGLDDWMSEDDTPVWEQPPAEFGNSVRTPEGYAGIYTWQSRRIRIVPEEDKAVGVVLTNGDKLEPYNRNGVEPMSSWRRSPNQEKKLGISPVYLPFRHRTGRAIWRGLTAFLPWHAGDGDDSFVMPGVVAWASFLSSINGGKHLEHDYRLKIHATAFEYGTQNAVVTELIDDSMMLSSYLLTKDGEDAALLAERCMSQTDAAVAKALGAFALKLRLAAGDDSERASDIRDKAKAEAYFELDGPFRLWLASLDSSTNLIQAESQWHIQARTILSQLAKRLVEDAGPDAIVGRTVKIGNKDMWLSAGSEERLFHYLLSKILPHEMRAVESEKEGRDDESLGRS